MKQDRPITALHDLPEVILCDRSQDFKSNCLLLTNRSRISTRLGVAIIHPSVNEELALATSSVASAGFPRHPFKLEWSSRKVGIFSFFCVSLVSPNDFPHFRQNVQKQAVIPECSMYDACRAQLIIRWPGQAHSTTVRLQWACVSGSEICASCQPAR